MADQALMAKIARKRAHGPYVGAHPGIGKRRKKRSGVYTTKSGPNSSGQMGVAVHYPSYD